MKMMLWFHPKNATFYDRGGSLWTHVVRGKQKARDREIYGPKMENIQGLTKLRGFLRLANYFSEYVPRYATMAGPLFAKLQLNKFEGKKGSQRF